MGRYNYSQPSSSSVSLWSAGSAEVNFIGRKFGIPDKCLCGKATVIKSSTTGENPGRIYFGCKRNKDGKDHIMKWWDEAIIEELQAIRVRLDDQRDSIIAIQENEDMLWVDQEISKVKTQVKELALPNQRRVVEVEKVLIAGTILIVVFMYFFIWFRRSFN